MQKIYFGYEAFRDDLKILTQKIDKAFDVLLPISRGGLSMGQMLGEFYGIREVYAINTIGYDDTQKLDAVKIFNIPLLKEGQRVLVVDDIVDSGDTLVEVLRVLQTKYSKTTFDTATIFVSPKLNTSNKIKEKQAKEKH